jgi:EmrB/QacA subfamily drug resistance transporter
MTESTDNPHHSRRWLILGLIGIAQLMVVLDATIVNIALPSAQDALGFSGDSRQWVVTAYALAFGSLLLLGGRLSDMYGRKWLFIIGLIGFAVASGIGGAAQSFEVLVGARALQGAFGALLAPAALSLLTTTFTDPDERGKAFGIYGAIAGGGAAVGLMLGGILTEYLSWRWCMFVNIFFAVPAALGALRLIHDGRPATRPRLDLPGTLTATSGLFALVYGFSSAETNGWSDSVTIIMFAASAALLVGFVAIQRRVDNPLLPLRVVLDRDRGGSYLSVAMAGIGMFGVFLFLTYYLQEVLGFSPIQAGAGFLPMTAAIVATATTVSSVLLKRVGPRPLVTLGMLIGAGSMVFLTGIGVDTSYTTHVLPGLITLGIGMGLIFAPAMSTATYGVRPSDAGVASAMVNTAQQVGGSVGTALLSTLAASAASSFVTDAGGRPTDAIMAQAAVHSYTTAFWWAAGIFAIGSVVAAVVLRPGPQRVDAETAGQPAMAH